MDTMLVVSLLACLCWSAFANSDDHLDESDKEFLYGKFPDGFMWGTATASYQIEGAWNISGKGENIWDRFSHTPGNVANGDTGDVACDSYHKYEEDIQLLKSLGVTHYRFSVSWSRVMSDGTSNTINQPGIDYYNRVIDGLIREGIVPMITLYHWDLPQALQDKGGWENSTIIQEFKNYADLLFRNYGDRVKYWITFNEPFVFTWLGLGIGVHAPGYSDGPDTRPYTAVHNVILSHAEAYHLYDQTYRPTQDGKIFITLDCDWKEPLDRNDQTHLDASETALQFKLGWFASPIFGTGDYPEVMKRKVAEKSTQQGLSSSRLPTFTAEQIQRNKGTSDYFGLNHYTTQYTFPVERGIENPSYENDQDIGTSVDPDWQGSGSDWLKVVPWGFRRLMVWIKDEYGNPPLIVTENGVSDRTGTLDDTARVNFYSGYVNNILKAIRLDGCDVRGYTAWSLLDNFEWAQGYTERFGLHYVDYTDDNRPRTPKESSKFFSSLIAENGFSSSASTDRISKLIISTCLFIAALTFWK